MPKNKNTPSKSSNKNTKVQTKKVEVEVTKETKVEAAPATEKVTPIKKIMDKVKSTVAKVTSSDPEVKVRFKSAYKGRKTGEYTMKASELQGIPKSKYVFIK